MYACLDVDVVVGGFNRPSCKRRVAEVRRSRGRDISVGPASPIAPSPSSVSDRRHQQGKNVTTSLPLRPFPPSLGERIFPRRFLAARFHGPEPNVSLAVVMARMRHGPRRDRCAATSPIAGRLGADRSRAFRASPDPTDDPGVELAFMPRTMTVTLLNEGGKYVAIDLKRIEQGGTCRMDKDATIARVGPGATPGTTRVRYAAAQVSSGGCPFLTTFDLPNSDYAAARMAFVQMKDRASKKVDEIKKVG